MSTYMPFRGRGGSSYMRGGRGGWSRAPVARALEVPVAPPPPLGMLIQEVKAEDLEGPAEKLWGAAKITESTFVASFNWLDSDEPTIAVPGRPPRWSPLAEPIEIPDDNGKYGCRLSSTTRKVFRDANAARFPKHPMEPAIMAILTGAQELCSERLPDVVACGSTIGNLLRFIRSQDKKPFRMLVEKVGNAVFFIRRENSPTELISDLQGYGQSFPEHYTTWGRDVKGSKSHQRIMRYRFGGMNFLVRFEGDGYIATDSNGNETLEPSAKGHASNAAQAKLIDELSASISSTKISSELGSSEADLKVVVSGERVDEGLIFDLKTRSSKKLGQLQELVEEELPRLWIAGITKFIVAFHNRGVFDDIRIMEAGEMVKQWEAANQQALAKLAALIRRIGEVTRGRPDGKLELCYSGVGDSLELREQLPDAGDALSTKVKRMWLVSEIQFDDDSDESEAGNSGTDDGGVGVEWDDGDGDDDDKDFTACSAHGCGYCGRCTY